jgi:hypothetical protein
LLSEQTAAIHAVVLRLDKRVGTLCTVQCAAELGYHIQPQELMVLQQTAAITPGQQHALIDKQPAMS